MTKEFPNAQRHEGMRMSSDFVNDLRQRKMDQALIAKAEEPPKDLHELAMDQHWLTAVSRATVSLERVGCQRF